jgi:hypothetical protein
LQQRIPRAPLAFVLSVSALIGADMFSAGVACAAGGAAPPAAAVIPKGGPPPPFAAPTETPTTSPASPASKLQYTAVIPGLLERSVYETTSAGALALAIDDILVAPGESVEVPATQFAALIEIEAGTPQLSIDGKSATAEPGRLVSIDQGHSLTIDNRQQQRGVVARLIKVQARGN